MTTSTSLDNDIKNSAVNICSPNSEVSLLDFQLGYWLKIKEIMEQGGYIALRKRIPHISEDLASAVARASLSELINLCSSEICTMRPSLDEGVLENLLSNDKFGSSKSAKTNTSLMALQLISERKAA